MKRRPSLGGALDEALGGALGSERALGGRALGTVLVMFLLVTFPAGPLGAETFGAGPLSAARLVDTVSVAVDPATSSVVLGENLQLSVTATNNGSDPTPPLVIHIDITDPDQSTSVDPEDWTSTLSKPIGAIAPGESVVVDWTIQPISAGTFSTYAVALSSGIDNIASSNVLEVRVADQRTLNPGGILPVAIGAPAIIGALLVLQMWTARRTGQPATITVTSAAS